MHPKIALKQGNFYPNSSTIPLESNHHADQSTSASATIVEDREPSDALRDISDQPVLRWGVKASRYKGEFFQEESGSELKKVLEEEPEEEPEIVEEGEGEGEGEGKGSLGWERKRGQGDGYGKMATEEEYVFREEDNYAEAMGTGLSKERRKPREFEVFIGGLDRHTTEDDLVYAFRKVGEVVDIRLVMRPLSRRGFAFVRFAKVGQARKAASELRFVEVRGNWCGVTRSNSNETLYLGNICTSWTKNDLVQEIKTYKLENLDGINLIGDSSNNSKNRGYAFLDFKTHMDALAACCKLQKEDIFLGTNYRAEVAFSKSVQPDEEAMSQVRSVFLDGLPTKWDESEIKRHFTKFGEIDYVQLACNMPTAKRKDFCFISFNNRNDALRCIEKINTDGISDGSEKISLKASLKRPERKLPLNYGIQRGYTNRKSEGFNSHGIDHSHFKRPIRTREFVSREYNDESTKHIDTFTSRHSHYRMMYPPTIDNYEDRPRKYVQRVPENFQRRSLRRDARDIHEKYEAQTSRDYTREMYRSRSRRDYIREIPENYASHSRRMCMRELPENYESSSRRVVYIRGGVPEKYENHYMRVCMDEIPEKYESHRRKGYVIEEPGNFDNRLRRNLIIRTPTAARSRSREHYVENSSRQHALGSFQDSLTTYTQPRQPYSGDEDDIYDTDCGQYDDRELETFDHPAFAGTKHQPLDPDNELPETSPIVRHHLRTLPNYSLDYERTHHGIRRYGNRYASRSTSRS
ncbi:hypothetical protein ZOSMA_77G00360 [Zostera marina]|uniref:RRM domain-containing protein n=1 Tax=Zostera marina TaxID=29655 RepID=A0A0K9NQL6_ZOSMR|nr:hypothetical protein ZOSMA_77G00360 [Zostera marina]